MTAFKNVKNKKRVAVVAGAGLLVAGLVGTGAVTTLQTALTGNHFEARVLDSENGETPEGGLLVLSGDPIVHTFDVTKYNDSVQGTWTLTNKGTMATTYDGSLDAAAGTTMPPSLAAQLKLEYGSTDSSGNVTAWHEAGTMATPTSYATALGLSSTTIAPDAPVTIPVRVTLTDPTQLEGAANDVLTLDATFTVSYVDPTA